MSIDRLIDTMKIVVRNIVLSGHMGKRVPLESIAEKLENVEYGCYERFTAMTLRLQSPKVTAFIFVTGKITIVGVKPEYKKIDVLSKIRRELKKAGFNMPVKFKMSVVNMVGYADLKTRLDLSSIASKFENATYEPEIFPGLIYRLPTFCATLNVFSSGKIIAFAKSKAQMERSVKQFWFSLKSADY